MGTIEDAVGAPGSDYAGTAPDGATGGSDTDSGSEGGAIPDGADTASDVVSLSTGCAAYDGSVYTPFKNYAAVSTGTVSAYPWRGPNGYPDAVENFRAYETSTTVECGASKSTRNYLDVTAGCLKSVSVSGDTKGQIELTTDGYFRSFALPWDAEHDRQVAWHDVGVEYRFYYSSWTGTEGNPGFKAFARYLTEYDLYVGSWRRDGVVQIQKKQCGVYTILKRDPSFGPPAPNKWHTIRFEAVGKEQRLYLDGKLAMTTTDSSIPYGTAGIRIDSADRSYIDDWRVYAP